MSELEAAVLRHLRPWTDGATAATIRALAVLLGVPRRSIEEIVETLRLQGHPIIGDKDGLHLARDSAELAAYIEARRRRLATIYKGNRALRVRLAEMKRAEENVTEMTLGLTA